MTPAETLAKAKELDGFLDRSVKEIRTMNKFEELALRSAALHTAAGERADRLAARLDALPELLDRAFGPQEAKLDDLERGATALENGLHSMIGHNGAPLEVLPPAAPVLPPVVEVLPPPSPVIEEAAPEPVEEPAPEPMPEPVVEPAPLPVVEPIPAAPAIDPTANGNAPA